MTIQHIASPLMTTKGLAGLLYRMGRTFDGLNTSRMATEEFLRTGNPNVVGSRNDYALLCDLKDASSYVIEYDYSTRPMDLAWFTGINAKMTRTAAMEPGVLRTAENVIVSTRRGTYTPPVPSAAAIEQELRLVSADDTANELGTGSNAATSNSVNVAATPTGNPQPLERASHLFATLAKMQPFGDGNKRTALLAANGLLLKLHSSAVLAVPVEPPDRDTFNDKLSAWYFDNDPSVIDWFANWNHTHCTEQYSNSKNIAYPNL
ncbi:Fic family protein [Bifidobacterium sp. ESL0732]|uniref:Fic family protein n=1 Tax=Bifidobacterium sp. ESL0732 TaxID=2983222 RepID=UPI0023F807AD|nr:Fic family protein [Bifidobacterium sp. ESL0732]WEV64628.1 Fic family protein [Bifidobacterium sp. ESL0732]